MKCKTSGESSFWCCHCNIARFLLLFIFFQSPVFSQSCDCPSLQKPDKKYCDEFDLVFTGTVDSVSSCNKTSKAFFTINEIFKGESPLRLPLEFDCSSPCMMSFSTGEIWLIYADYKSFGLAETKFCSRSRKLFMGEESDYYLLNSGMKFEEEVSHLKKLQGRGKILEDKQKNEMQERSLIRPDGKTTLILLLVSVAGFLLIWYLAKKYFK